MPKASYLLTPTAREHLREAKAWSQGCWGKKLTKEYFHELEKAAIFIAENHANLTKNRQVFSSQSLGIYPVREHYIVFITLSKNKIAIVDFIRQGRDIPSILSKYGLIIQRELDNIRKNINEK